MAPNDRFITVAIHTYEKAIALRALLEREGIEVQFRNVNIEQPVVASGIRVRINENDLPLALRIIENREIFADPVPGTTLANPSLPILVPVDFSDNSFEATKSAFHIASCHQTNIVLLHTYIDPYVAGSMQLTDSLTYEIADASAREQVRTTAEAQMRHFSARIKELMKSGELPAVKFTTCVMEGVPEDAITEYTRSNNPFLIVMGTRGAKKKEMEMIGSVTAEVLDKCRFSVLALPEGPQERSITSLKNILFFSNLDQDDILAIDSLYRFFPKAEANVTIALLASKKRNFFRSTADAGKALCDYCNRNFKGYKFTTATLDTSNVVSDLKWLESKTNYDLVAVPNKKKNIIFRIFNPSLAHKVLFSADVPMLVIPV